MHSSADGFLILSLFSQIDERLIRQRWSAEDHQADPSAFWYCDLITLKCTVTASLLVLCLLLRCTLLSVPGLIIQKFSISLMTGVRQLRLVLSLHHYVNHQHDAYISSCCNFKAVWLFSHFFFFLLLKKLSLLFPALLSVLQVILAAKYRILVLKLWSTVDFQGVREKSINLFYLEKKY